MMIAGWCSDCRRVKTVRVSNAGMVRLATGGVAEGQCTACAQAEADANRERWESRRRGR